MVDWKRLAILGVGVSLYPTVKGFVQQFTGKLGVGAVAGLNVADIGTFVLAGYLMDRVSGDWRDLVAGISAGAIATLISPYIAPVVGKVTGGGSTSSGGSSGGSSDLDSYLKTKYGV
jgi:hypothetical protein